MPFIPATDDERRQMLEVIGVKTFEDLLKNIPPDLRFQGELPLPPPLSEMEVFRLLRSLAKQNETVLDTISFLGGGAYDHFIPAAIEQIISRPEFYTAYTPYQAEVSQGTLQAIYEYQSLICELTGMEASNASMYDGGSALAEAALMAHAETSRNELIVSQTVNPWYRKIIQTYAHGQGISVIPAPMDNGITDLSALRKIVSRNTAGVILQHPNFFGCLEEVEQAENIIHEVGALYITSNDPISLGLLKPPGEYGADIATAEGQGLGNSLSLGGPYLGILAVRENLIRKMPGRIAGATVDTQGRRGFVLTLQTREQHIRREKATSNICTNQALNALAATVYLALLGKKGLQEVAQLCLQKSHYLAEKIGQLDGFKLKFDRPFFKEFVVDTPIPAAQVIQRLQAKRISAGIDLSRFDLNLDGGLLIAVTEKRTRDEMDKFVEELKILSSY